MKTSRAFIFVLAAWSGAASALALPVTVPKGTVIQVRTVGAFDSDTVKKGDRVMLVVYPAVFVGSQQAVPRAAIVMGQIKHVRAPKDGAKSAAIALKFEELRIGTNKWDIEGVLTSLQADDTKKILEHQAKMATGRKVDVILIGAGTEANKRASMLVGTTSTSRDELADEWAVSALGPPWVAIAADTVLAMRLDKTLTLEESFGAPPESPDRVILTTLADVRKAQEALKRLRIYTGPVNGLLDEPTRRAIARYQIDKGQAGTGDLEKQTLEALAAPAKSR